MAKRSSKDPMETSPKLKISLQSCNFGCGLSFKSIPSKEKHEVWSCPLNPYVIAQSAGKLAVDRAHEADSDARLSKRTTVVISQNEKVVKHLMNVKNRYSLVILAQELKCFVPGVYPLVFMRNDSKDRSKIEQHCSVNDYDLLRQIIEESEDGSVELLKEIIINLPGE